MKLRWSTLRTALSPRRFGTQIALAVLALAAVNFVAIGLYVGNRFVDLQTQDTWRRFEAVADNLSLGAAPLVITHDFGSLDQMLEAAARFPGMRSLAVTNSRGHVLSRVNRSAGGKPRVSYSYGALPLPSGGHARMRWLDGDGHVVRAGLLSIPKQIQIWYPIESGQLGWLYLHASVKEILAEAALLARDSLLVLLLLSLTGAAVLFGLLRPGVSALARATAFARRLGRADAGQLAIYQGNQELEVLGRTLNETSAKLLRQEAAVRANQLRIEAIVENLADGVVLTDDKGLILSANSAFCAMFASPREQVLGSCLLRYLPELVRADAAGETEADLQSYCERQGAAAEVHGVRGDGSTLPVALGMNRFLIDDQCFYVGALHDLRERNRWIAELQATRDAALAASRAKSDFLAAMSHEIRTPMNGMIGMLDLLLQSSLNEQQARMADISRSSALALLAIINDLLDLSKIEAGKLQILDEPLQLEPLVQEVALLFDQLAQKKGIELSAWVDPALPARLRGDGLRIRQLLTNLLSNAVKFTGGEQRPGRVWLRVEPCAEAPAEQMCLSVRDNGIGIDPQDVQRLFLPFEQADSYTTKRFGGTGLGLSICNHLVQMMGGRIDVRSALGEGSEFRIILPLRADGQARPDVSGVLRGEVCAVVGPDSQRARDLLACLAASGAQASRVDAPAQAPAAAALLWLVTPVAVDPAPRWQLLVGDGRRRAPRALAGGIAQFDACLLSRPLLERAVRLAIHGPDEIEQAQPQAGERGAMRAPGSRAEALRQQRLVLVAEDNPTNQEVIRLQLQRLGLWADIAPDGEQALARWKQQPYAAVLSDLHMPRMDGFGLALAMRAEEARRGRAPTPLIALTAAAQPQELERALRSGMDAHMTKPVSLEVMRQTLQRFVPALAAEAALPQAGGPQPATPATRPALDTSVLRELVGDDAETLQALLAQYAGELRQALPELQRLAAASELGALAQLAHRLKSSSRSVGATALADCLQGIESGAAQQRGEQLAAAVAELPALAERVLHALAG